MRSMSRRQLSILRTSFSAASIVAVNVFVPRMAAAASAFFAIDGKRCFGQSATPSLRWTIAIFPQPVYRPYRT
jgi:hypothetical protein